MTPEHRQADAQQQVTIRLGRLTTECRDFALQFQTIQNRNGVPRPLCVCGSMPSFILRWEGSGYSDFKQSLQ